MSGISWPKRGAKLCISGGDYYEFAHFGWGNIPEQFSGYIEGYKFAADELISRVLDLKDISKIDTVVFPILFLYRQYLELELKWIFLRFSMSSGQEKKDFLNRVNHNMIQIWDHIKPIIAEEASPDELQDIQTVEDYLKQFHELDRNSFTFRYPITKNLDEVITNEHRLNLSVFKERMEELYCFFNGVNGQLESIRDFTLEMEEYFI